MTILDISRTAGVSTATVSRVLNGSARVRPETRRRVLEVVRELNYQPHHAARALAARATRTLGVVFPEIHSGFYTEVLRGIDDTAHQRGYHLSVVFMHGAEEERELLGRFVKGRLADGLILVNLMVSEMFLESPGMPVVFVNRPAIGGDEVMRVAFDNAAGAESAMAHLLGHGYRDVALLTGPTDNPDSRDRLEGCFRALRRAGLSRQAVRVWHGAFTEESGLAATRKHLAGGRKPPQAVFAFNDAMALGVLAGLSRLGLRVPEDVALVGFDDCEVARYIGLTTVGVPMRELGRRAAEMIFRRMNRRDVPDGYDLLDTHLVVRRSCGCAGMGEVIAENGETRETIGGGASRRPIKRRKKQ